MCVIQPQGSQNLKIYNLYLQTLQWVVLLVHTTGNLTNTFSVKKQLVQSGSIFQTSSDTEIILQLVARSKKIKLIDKLTDALSKIQGAYSLIILTNKKLIGVRIHLVSGH